jgi:hypothetical protein
MPTPTEDLRVGADEVKIREAMSQCVSQLVGEGRDQDQAIAICQDQLRKATGRPL